MLRQISLLLFGFLIIASAVPAQHTKTLFSLDSGSAFTYQMFQTRNGVIGYAMDSIPTSYSEIFRPQYYLFNLTSTTVTPILNDLLTACNQTSSTVIDRLHYHNPTMSLVYYCTKNNSLLILDEDDYTVQSSIQVATTTIFKEVKLSTDEYNVAVLGMDTIFSSNPTPSQLIRISMQSKTVVSKTTFDHDLAEKEAVTGFDTNGKTLYVLTTTTIPEKSINVTIYSMTLIGSSYQLTHFTNFKSDYLPYPTFAELFCVGDLIITNSYSYDDSGLSLLYYNKQGITIKSEPSLLFQNLATSLPSRPAVVVDYESSNVYSTFQAIVWESTFNVTQHYIKGSTIDSTFITVASDMKVAVAAQPDHSLLFSVDPTGWIFNITDLETLDVMYNTVVDPAQVMITNTTYALTYVIETGTYLYIYDLETNNPISSYFIETQNYFDQESNIIATLSMGPTINQTTLNMYNLETGAYSSSVFNDPSLYDSTTLVQFGLNNASAPGFVIRNYNATYTIVVPEYGEVLFTNLTQGCSAAILVMDFNAMMFYYMTGGTSTNATETTIYHYALDAENKSFSLESTQVIYEPVSQYAAISKTQVVVYDPLYGLMYGIIDMSVPTGIQVNNPTNQQWFEMTTFTDYNGDPYVVLTNSQYTLNQGYSLPMIFDKTFEPLVDSTNTTIRAYAGGKNSYWTEDYNANFYPIKFYSVSGSSETMSITA